MDNQQAHWIKKILLYCLGMFIISLGVSFSVKSDLGVSPVNSIPYVLSLISGIEQGRCVTAVFICFMGLQFLILLHQFRPRNLLQIIVSFIYGLFITLGNRLTAGIPPCTNYPMRLLYLCISMVLIALGISLYLKPGLLPLPVEGVVQAITVRFRLRFVNVKIGVDTTMVIIAGFLSLLFFRELVGVREGTIISALGTGQLMKVWNKLTKRMSSPLC